jgi:hypothetical protein
MRAARTGLPRAMPLPLQHHAQRGQLRQAQRLQPPWRAVTTVLRGRY